MDKQVLVIEDKAVVRQVVSRAGEQKNAHVEQRACRRGRRRDLAAGGDVAAGKQLFAQKCTACHKLAPFDQNARRSGASRACCTIRRIPNLVDGDPATPADVAKILQNGYTGSMGAMPNASANGLSDKDIADLVAFLNTLK